MVFDTKTKYYAGIGSRSTPKEILDEMIDFGVVMAKIGYVLRSGAADGADTAFEQGCDKVNKSLKQIWLPWPKFNNHTSFYCNPTDQAMSLGRDIHPNGKFLKRPAALLHARNMHQILGEDLNTPVQFVICWTPDGCEDQWNYSFDTGGTGSAIACADRRGIPVFNLQNMDRLYMAYNYVKTLQQEGSL